MAGPGPKDLGSRKAYNPKLATGDSGFQEWYRKNTLEGKAGVPYTDKQAYDYYSFYRNGDYKDKSFNIEAHFPDTYKRPDHVTFSDESIYSTPENPGGSWKGETYIPYKPKLTAVRPTKRAYGGPIGPDPLQSKRMLDAFGKYKKTPQGMLQPFLKPKADLSLVPEGTHDSGKVTGGLTATGQTVYPGAPARQTRMRKVINGNLEQDRVNSVGPAPFGATMVKSDMMGSPVANTNPVPESGTKKGTGGVDAGKVKGGVDKVMPFASNIVNSLRKPPAPTKGRHITAPGLAKVSFDQERAQIDRDTRSADMLASRAVDEQTASAIAGANKARAYEARGASYAREATANTEIANRQAQMNLSVDAQNAAMDKQYNDEVIGMKMAHQREQSQNLSNAADKYVGIQNEQAKRDLELKKYGVMSQAYTNGITDRLVRKILNKPEGDLTDEDMRQATSTATRKMGGSLRKVFAGGGTMGPGDKNKPGTGTGTSLPTTATVAEATALAKDIARRKGHINAESTHTGGVIPKVELNGVEIPYGANIPGLNKPRTYKPIPRDVTEFEYDGASNQAWWKNRDGDLVEMDPNAMHLPQFKKQNATSASAVNRPVPGAVASLAMGGKLGKMRGKIRKVY